jgi:hypothetical protein
MSLRATNRQHRVVLPPRASDAIVLEAIARYRRRVEDEATIALWVASAWETLKSLDEFAPARVFAENATYFAEAFCEEARDGLLTAIRGEPSREPPYAIRDRASRNRGERTIRRALKNATIQPHRQIAGQRVEITSKKKKKEKA